MKGERPVIPSRLRPEYINRMHAGHLGPDSTKQRARDVAFWPSMGKDIEDRVKKCAVCNSTKAHQQKEPLPLYPVPDTPWSLVAAADLMTWDSKQYLVLVDSYSGWWEVNY